MISDTYIDGAAGRSLRPHRKGWLYISIAALEGFLSLCLFPSIEPSHREHTPYRRRQPLGAGSMLNRGQNLCSHVIATDDGSVQFS